MTQLTPNKPFAFEPFRLRDEVSVHRRLCRAMPRCAAGENTTASIMRCLPACAAATGYPKGAAYSTVPQGLLLRPAIPTDDFYTYGPKANFKISLRELPDDGRFRVTVTAAKYNDGLLLDPGARPQSPDKSEAVICRDPQTPRTRQHQAGRHLPGGCLRRADKSARARLVTARRGLDRSVADGGKRGEQSRSQGVGRPVGRECSIRPFTLWPGRVA